MNDPIGRAIADFYEYGEAPDILVQTNYTADERLSPDWFFRTEEQMPLVERIALSKSFGKVLDVGAGAGCHALILQERGFEVTAIDQSPLAVDVMKKRGVQQAVCTDIFHFSGKGFDTVLVLMNGTGIGQTISGLQKMLEYLKKFLSPEGQILIDSSDIHYLFEEEDGSQWVDLANDQYYGEMEYELSYKDTSVKFPWLFTDFSTLSDVAEKAGLDCTLVVKGEQDDFLARMKPFF